jgi:nitrogen regulatory protein PII
MLGGQQDVVSGVAYKPYAKVEATTNEAVARHGANQAIIELAGQVNQKCVDLQERVIRSALVIVHPNNEVYNAIKRCVDDACGGVTNQQALRECVRAESVVRVLIGFDIRGNQICPIVWRLLNEELHGNIKEVHDYLENEVNAVVNRLGMAPEEFDKITREVEGSIGDGEPYVSRILDAINDLAKRRVRAREFARYVRNAVVDESNNRLIIHIVLGDGDRKESFNMVVKRGDIGWAFVGDRDVEVWVTDLARKPRFSDKGVPLNGNISVIIPKMLIGDIDRFLGYGLIPDFSTIEFYESIKNKLETIKTPEEMLREAVGSAFAKFVWVTVSRNGVGGYETDSELTGEPQGYAYLLDDEIWLPYYLWTVFREELEKHGVLETSVRAWVRETRRPRSIVKKWDGRSVVIRNLVILDRRKVEEALGGSVEDYIIHKEKPANDWDVDGEA